jgi:hypothetical protein
MRRIGLFILVALTAWTLDARQAAAQSVAQAAGEDEASVLTQPPRGSLAAQLRLKLSLQMAGGSSLAAAMDHNRAEWRMLTPDQREQFRNSAMAFLEKDPKAQEKVLNDASFFQSLNREKQQAYRQREAWVKAVVATFTPEQRAELRKMSSADQARVLMERRSELVRQGRLNLTVGEPATAPAATMPTAQQ